MNKHEFDWMRGMHKPDTSAPTECLDGEPVYTVYMADFMRMPDVNFVEVASVDTHVKALLN